MPFQCNLCHFKSSSVIFRYLLTLVLSSISSRRCSPLITRHTRAIRQVFDSGPGTSFSQVALRITVDVFVRSLTESGEHLRAFAFMAFQNLIRI